MHESFYTKYVKRCIDLLVSSLMIILLSPLMIVVAVLIRIKIGNPIIFNQPRPGKNGVVFSMMKFRTMTEHRNQDGELLADEVRLTSFGKFVRSTSLDELPGFFNIFLGNMSLVGPRPLLVEYLPLYNQHQARRHLVRPGLTGLAQVNGRNGISWEEKFDLDVKYVDNVSFLLDLKICIKTVLVVFKRSNISQEGQATITKFEGSDVE